MAKEATLRRGSLWPFDFSDHAEEDIKAVWATRASGLKAVESLLCKHIIDRVVQWEEEEAEGTYLPLSVLAARGYETTDMAE